MQVKFNTVQANNYSYRKNNPNFCSKKAIRNTRKKTNYNPIALRALGLLSPEKLAILALNQSQEVKSSSKAVLMKAKTAKCLSDNVLNKSEEVQNLAQNIIYNSSSDYNYSLEVSAKKEKIQQQTDKEFSTIADFLMKHSKDINKLSSKNDEITFPYEDGVIAILRNKDKYVYEQYNTQGTLSKKAIIDTSSKNMKATIYDFENSSIYEYEMQDNNPVLKSCSIGIKSDSQGKHIKEKYAFENGVLKSYKERVLEMPNHEYANVYITYDDDKTMFAYDYNSSNGHINTSCASVFDKDELKLYSDNYQIAKDGSSKSSQTFKFEKGKLTQFDLAPEGRYSNGRYLYNEEGLQTYCKIIDAGNNKPVISKSITFEDNKMTDYHELATRLSLKFKNGSIQSAAIGKNKNNVKEKYYFTDENLNAYQKDVEENSKIGQTMVFSDGELSKYSLNTRINEDGSAKSDVTLKFTNNKLSSVIR